MLENTERTIGLARGERVRLQHSDSVIEVLADESGHLEVQTRQTMIVQAGHLGAYADEDSVEPNGTGVVRLQVH